MILFIKYKTQFLRKISFLSIHFIKHGAVHLERKTLYEFHSMHHLLLNFSSFQILSHQHQNDLQLNLESFYPQFSYFNTEAIFSASTESLAFFEIYHGTFHSSILNFLYRLYGLAQFLCFLEGICSMYHQQTSPEP
jgi:hypothetical protein